LTENCRETRKRNSIIERLKTEKINPELPYPVLISAIRYIEKHSTGIKKLVFSFLVSMPSLWLTEREVDIISKKDESEGVKRAVRGFEIFDKKFKASVNERDTGER
jgi:hypothetical protein